MSKYVLRILVTIGLCFAFFLIWQLFKDVNWNDLQNIFASTGFLLLLVLVPFFFTSLSDAYAWLFFLKNNKPTIFQTAKLRIATESLQMSLPLGVALNEGLRPYYLHKIFFVPYHEGIASVLVKKIFLAYAHVIMITICSLCSIDFLLLFYEKTSIPIHWLILISTVLIFFVFTFLLVLILFGNTSRKIFFWLSQSRFHVLRAWAETKSHAFDELETELALYRNTPFYKYIQPVFWLVMMWVFEIFDAVVILYIMDVSISISNIAIIEITFTLVKAFVSFLPSGIGVQDFGYLIFFQMLQISHPLETTQGFVIIKRSKELCWMLLGYLILFQFNRIINANTRKSDSSNLEKSIF